jgi:hypothetical protein
MAVLLWFSAGSLDWVRLQSQPLERAALVLALVAAGGIVYLLALLALGLRPRALLRQPAIRQLPDLP